MHVKVGVAVSALSSLWYLTFFCNGSLEFFGERWRCLNGYGFIWKQSRSTVRGRWRRAGAWLRIRTLLLPPIWIWINFLTSSYIYRAMHLWLNKYHCDSCFGGFKFFFGNTIELSLNFLKFSLTLAGSRPLLTNYNVERVFKWSRTPNFGEIQGEAFEFD